MNDLLKQVETVAKGIWRYRWRLMAVAWAVALVGWLAVHVLVVPRYEATAQIYADTETVLQPLMEGIALDLDVQKQVTLMARQVMSRPILERVVDEMGLTTKGENPVPTDVAVEQLRGNLTLTAERPQRRGGFANLYNLSYVHEDPVIAKEAVETLISVFTDSTADEIRRESEKAKRFIEQRIAQQVDVVAAKAARVRDFKRRHMAVLSGEGLTFYERLQAAEGAVSDVERQIAETESLRDNLEKELDETPLYTRAVTEDGSLVPTRREARLAKLRAQLEELSLRYTASHPEVIAKRDTIARVEAQIRAGDNPAPRMVNPMHQKLEMRVREVSSGLAALRSRREAALRDYEALLTQVSTIPGIEDELGTMTRDLEGAEEHLTALEERRQSMEASETVDQETLKLYFRVIEPVRVPVDSVLNGVVQQKALMSVVVFALALGAGGVLAYGVYLLAPPIFSQRALVETTSLPVIGVVSQIQSRGAVIRERMDLASWLTALVLMICALGVVIFFHLYSTYGAEEAEAILHELWTGLANELDREGG